MVGSLVWFFWFYLWEKVKRAFEPLVPPVEEIFRESSTKSKDELIEQIKQSDDLEPEEKEMLERDINIEYERNFNQMFKEYKEGLGDFPMTEIIMQRVVTLIISLLDGVVMLLPFIFYILGQHTIAILIFGVHGLIGTMSVEDEVIERGLEVGVSHKVLIVITFLLIQMPFIVALLLNISI